MGWLAFFVLLFIVGGLYNNLNTKIERLNQDLKKLQDNLQQQKDSSIASKPTSVITDPKLVSSQKGSTVVTPSSSSSSSASASASELESTTAPDLPFPSLSEPPKNDSAGNEDSYESALFEQALLPQIISQPSSSKPSIPTPIMEPDERSLTVVTSLVNSLKNWFLGGNLVVRVGVLVLLVGVVLLLRLISEYFETPIEVKLAAIAIVGFGLAGLGLKLASKRFAYGITLQGAGLAIAYLTTFFAYDVYDVLPSLPSFIALGVISAVTIGLAVRQNAFPLALLALSGGFFAPLLTATDTGSLTALFSYYLLLNVAVAIIAHYKTWKVLNVLGVAVTFGLAYYFGSFVDISSDIQSQRWSLVLLVALHLALYLFIAIRYTQQIIAYNISHEASAVTVATTSAAAPATTKTISSLYLYPMDIGLLFSVPVLAFGLFAALLHDINQALTITSAILGAVYLGLGWLLIKRSQRYALITEGMLALGFGFLALVVPLAFDAEWVAAGWSIQGIALIWFGRRTLRAWLIIFGLLLQIVSVGGLFLNSFFFSANMLALSLSAIASLATVFILRASNSPSILLNTNSQSNNPIPNATDTDVVDSNDSLEKYATSLGISTQAARHWLASINNQSATFNMIWRSPAFISFLTAIAIIWTLYVLITDFDIWFKSWQLATTTLIALAALASLTLYWLINRYRAWAEIRHLSLVLLNLFYLALVLQLPQKFEFNQQWSTVNWLIFTVLLIGWALVGQLWLKIWYAPSNNTTKKVDINLALYHFASWLGTGVLVLAAGVYYGLSDSDGVVTVAIVSLCLIALGQFAQRNLTSVLPWFDWHKALAGCSLVFIPVLLIWIVITNWYHNGVVWDLPYIPVLNLYDIAILLSMGYALTVYYSYQNNYIENADTVQSVLDSGELIAENLSKHFNILLKVIGIIGFWVLSSMLVRTLHAYAATPLWPDNAWGNDKVQTSLTILWTLTALIATFMSSRNGKRFWWFMGIGLLGVVVLKLVLVDLSQTGAILRVISFLVAGSLILLIGYLAPLPPERDKEINKVKKNNGANSIEKVD